MIDKMNSKEEIQTFAESQRYCFCFMLDLCNLLSTKINIYDLGFVLSCSIEYGFPLQETCVHVKENFGDIIKVCLQTAAEILTLLTLIFVQKKRDDARKVTEFGSFCLIASLLIM